MTQTFRRLLALAVALCACATIVIAQSSATQSSGAQSAGAQSAGAQSGRRATSAQPGSRPPSGPATFGIGRPATAADISAWDDDVMPDGTGLPAGSGTPAAGAPIFAARCAACHGRTGKEGPNDVLVGAPQPGFAFAQRPELPHTIGSYWPYATTVFDYIRRAMPPDAPGSLSDSDVYNLTAFLLHANELIPADAVIDATTLPKVVMPARAHFVPARRKP